MTGVLLTNGKVTLPLKDSLNLHRAGRLARVAKRSEDADQKILISSESLVHRDGQHHDLNTQKAAQVVSTPSESLST